MLTLDLLANFLPLLKGWGPTEQAYACHKLSDWQSSMLYWQDETQSQRAQTRLCWRCALTLAFNPPHTVLKKKLWKTVQWKFQPLGLLIFLWNMWHKEPKRSQKNLHSSTWHEPIQVLPTTRIPSLVVPKDLPLSAWMAAQPLGLQSCPSQRSWRTGGPWCPAPRLDRSLVAELDAWPKTVPHSWQIKRQNEHLTFSQLTTRRFWLFAWLYFARAICVWRFQRSVNTSIQADRQTQVYNFFSKNQNHLKD